MQRRFKSIVAILFVVSLLCSSSVVAFATDNSESQKNYMQMSSEEYAQWKAAKVNSDSIGVQATFSTFLRSDYQQHYLKLQLPIMANLRWNNRR